MKFSFSLAYKARLGQHLSSKRNFRGVSFVDTLTAFAIISAGSVGLLAIASSLFEQNDRERQAIVADQLLLDAELYFRRNCQDFMSEVAGYGSAIGIPVGVDASYATISEFESRWVNEISVPDIRSEYSDADLYPDIADKKADYLFSMTPSTSALLSVEEDLNGYRVMVNFDETLNYVTAQLTDLEPTTKLNLGAAQVLFEVYDDVPAEYATSTNEELKAIFHADDIGFVEGVKKLKWVRNMQRSQEQSLFSVRRRAIPLINEEEPLTYTHTACHF